MRPSKRDDEELALLGLIGLGIAGEELSQFTPEAAEEEPALLDLVETDSDDRAPGLSGTEGADATVDSPAKWTKHRP